MPLHPRSALRRARLGSPGGRQTATMVLLDLAGSIALLLWGIRMVRTGVARAFGARLRALLARTANNRLLAFASGLGITVLLQSSTATALIVTSFTRRAMMQTATALAVMLGADLGTGIATQIFSISRPAIGPLLVLVGVATFLSGEVTRRRDIGRILIGLGLTLLALRLILEASGPLRDGVVVRDMMTALGGQPMVALALAASLTWLAHSSLATVLFFMSIASSGTIDGPLALALVLGANVGGALPALTNAMTNGPEARRVALANASFKLVGALVFLPFLAAIAGLITEVDPEPGRLVVDFHLLFNLALAAILPAVGPVANFFEKIMPAAIEKDEPGRPRYLDSSAVDMPAVALTYAARETLHMGDIVETMLRRAMTALVTDDRKLVQEVERMDNAVDRLHEAIKLYVTGITRESLDDADGRRAMEVIAFTTNLEHIGDIIDKNLMELAAKKIKAQAKFSADGEAELKAFHQHVLDNLKLAMGVFISGDRKIARQLLDEKVRVRDAERAAAENHFARLREGRPESIASSGLHLDVLRDLKRIHSHICAVAYPILDAAGELRQSRLKEAEENVATPPQLDERAAHGRLT